MHNNMYPLGWPSDGVIFLEKVGLEFESHQYR